MTPEPPINVEMLLEHAGFVRAAARAAIGHDDAVEDAVQETFATALTKPPQGPRSLRAWLGTVARHRALDLVRARGRTEKRERHAARGEQVPSTLSVAARAETGRILIRAVMELPGIYRDAILLRYYDGLSPKRMGQVLEVPTETARTRVKRGLERLRHVLDERHGGDRRSWIALLTPLVPAPAPAAAAAGAGGVVLGVLIVKKMTVVGLVCLIGMMLWQVGRGDGEAPVAPEVTPAPSPEAKPEAEPVLETRRNPAAPQEAERPDASALPSDAVVIRGRVLDARRRPVRGAHLSVSTSPPMPIQGRGVSGADGTFAFAGPARSARHISFIVHAAHAENGGLTGRTIGAHAPAEIDVGAIVLRPVHSLEVRVRAEAGGVLAGARVYVEAVAAVGSARVYGSGHGGWARTLLRSASTTADGTCLLPALPQGMYRVMATAEGYGRGVATVPLPHRGVGPLVITLLPPREVGVLVVDARTREPVRGATLLVEEYHEGVSLMPGQAIPYVPQIDGLVTNAEGRAQLPGLGLHDAIRVRAIAAGYPRPIVSRRPRPQPSPVVDGEIRIKLQKLRPMKWPLAGDDEHAPPEGSVLQLRREPGGMAFPLPTSGRIENGHVVAEGCAPGLFRLMAVAPDGAFTRLLAMPSRNVGAVARFQRPKQVLVIVENADGSAAQGVYISLRGPGNVVIVEPALIGPGGRSTFDVYGASRADVFGADTPTSYGGTAIGSLDLRGREGGTVRWTLPAAGRWVELAVTIDGEARLPSEYWLRCLHAPELCAEEDPELGILRFCLPASATGSQTIELTAKGFLTATIKVPEAEGSAVVRTRADLKRGGHCLLRIKPPTDGHHQVFIQREGPSPPEAHLRVLDPLPVDHGSRGGLIVIRHGPLSPGTYHAIDRLSRSRSAAFEIEEGEESEVDFDLSAVRTVHGTVVVPNGYAAGVAQVKVSGEGLYEGAHARMNRAFSFSAHLRQGGHVRPDGTFQIRIPGGEKVRLTAQHRRLVAAAEGGSIEVTKETQDVRLTLVEGGSASFTLDPPIPASASSNPASYVTVLLYEGVPKGDALEALTPAHRDGVFTVVGFKPGTYTLVVDVPGRAPKVPPRAPAVLRGVRLGDMRTDLGTITLPRGATVRIKLKVKAGEPAPRIVADARFTEGAACGRVVNSRGEREVLLKGLGAGRFELRASPFHGLINGGHGGRQSIRRTLESDGQTEIVVEMDLR